MIVGTVAGDVGERIEVVKVGSVCLFLARARVEAHTVAMDVIDL